MSEIDSEDSEFKYGSDAESDANDEWNGAVGDGFDSCHCGGADCSRSIDCADFDLISFFLSYRRQHYSSLNRFVFRPLASKLTVHHGQSAKWITEDFRCMIYGMPSQSSDIYKLAMNHLQLDDPQIPKGITRLHGMVESHNEFVNELRQKIDRVVKEKITFRSTPINIGNRNYEYHYDGVIEYISTGWRPTMRQETISPEKVIEFIQKSQERRTENGEAYFNEVFVGKTEHKSDINKMKAAINEILTDSDLINDLATIQKSLNLIIEQNQKIQTMVSIIVDQIDQRLYNRRVAGCCSTRDILRQIIG